MNKKYTILLTLFITGTLSVSADYTFPDGMDYTGETYFESTPVGMYQEGKSKHSNGTSTTPPVKMLRLNIQNKLYERAANKMELAPTADESEKSEEETGITDYVSKEITDDFDDMTPDGFEADEEAVTEKNNKKLFSGKKNNAVDDEKSTEDIVLDCENVDYDTINYLIKANGNVTVNFVNQKTTVKSDTLIFDRINNTIKAEGNVRILKSGRVVTGDYIFVDLNEENALIENPLTKSDSIEIRAQKGSVYGDKIIQEHGQMTISDSYPIEFRSGRRGPRTYSMLTPKDETITEDIENGLIRMRADSIKIKQKGDLEVIAIKKGQISKGKHTILKIPAIKIYTNKNHDYAETNFWEVGYYRGLGLYTGPGWVFELPKGSVLKAVPFLNYNTGVGIGGLGRFSSGTNETTVAYGTAASKFFVSGRQELDDNLFLHYSMNSYMDEWFLGRRRPKYGAALVYSKGYSSKGFLLPDRTSSFTHRIEGGYFHNLDFDSHFERIKNGGNIGTTRFRYMAEIRQALLEYENEEKLAAFSVNLVSQLSAALYGTGDTQVVGKLGPSVSMQYKRWKQDIAYFFNAYEDNTPMLRYDSFRYGSQYLSLREYFRICKWLTVSWFTNINTTNDSINGRKILENAFYLSVGPDDFKMHLGYDFERQIFRAAFEVMMDAKGTNVEYNTFEIKQDKKASKSKPVEDKKAAYQAAPTQPKVLQRAVVEDIKVSDDVL